MPHTSRMISLIALAIMFSSPSTAQKRTAKKKPAPPTAQAENACPSLEGLTPVSKSFLRDHNLYAEELKNLQFYVEKTILLSRLVAPTDERVASGKLITL